MPRKAKEKIIRVSAKGFMSLRDFLLVGRVDNESVIDEYNTGPEWIKLYDIAKTQFLTYGLTPPIGAFVTTLRGGMGGPVGLLKKITGIETFGEKEYFILERGENSQENVSYLVDKLIWWAYFIVIPESEQPKKPKDIF